MTYIFIFLGITSGFLLGLLIVTYIKYHRFEREAIEMINVLSEKNIKLQNLLKEKEE